MIVPSGNTISDCAVRCGFTSAADISFDEFGMAAAHVEMSAYGMLARRP